MKRYSFSLVLAAVTFVLISLFLFPKQKALPRTTSKPEYAKAKVTEVKKQGTYKPEGSKENFFYQDISIRIVDGNDKGKTLNLAYGKTTRTSESQKLSQGDMVVLNVLKDQGGKKQYIIWDKYRLPSLLYVFAAFIIFVIVIAGKKGLGALIGMGISLMVILSFIVPQILLGNDPLFISIVGSIIILTVTIYLAHGFSQRTTVALLATGVSLVLTGICAVVSVSLAQLSGLGTEEVYFLQLQNNTINLQGLLLGGMIIGALGVLDDITTTQAAAVYAIANANPKLPFQEVFLRGYEVGKEHVTSLVNTLVLAYAGASLGLFILFVLNPVGQPIWFIINSEMVSEEIVRTLAGSIGIVLAVPITTLLASFFATHSIKIK